MRVSEAVNGTKRTTHLGTLYNGKEYTIRADEDVSKIDLFEMLLGDQYYVLKTKALRHAALKIKKNTLTALRAAFPRAFSEQNINKKGYTDKMSNAVQVGALKGGMNHMEIKVHILGSRASSSGTFRLRFFEGGNFRNPDRDKDGKKRGDLPALRFFRTGVKSVNFTEMMKRYLENYTNMTR